MYRIYADDTLIYDSTLEDYKIGKGQISLEINKAGSFVFSLYPEHFYYDQFVRLKTVITVFKSGRIVFRGRVLNDTTDYHNNKVLTCEGELGFLRDSIVRPFEFNGTIAEFFTMWIEHHNEQVDEFKRFKVGKITTTDSNGRIYRNSEQYEKTLDSLNSRTVNSDLGGFFLITHGENGTDEIPTIHYLSDSEKIATQTIEFGVNLKDYVKTVSAEEIATAIIPYSKPSNADSNAAPLTITDINNGKDYVYSETGVALYGWIFKTVEYKDVINPKTLMNNAYEDLEKSIIQNVSVELNAIDMHLFNRSIDSFNLCDYIRVFSPPHNFDSTLMCSKQTLDLLNPSHDKVTLGFAYSAFTQTVNQTTISNVNKNIAFLINRVSKTESTVTQQAEMIEAKVSRTEYEEAISNVPNYSDLTQLGDRVTEAEAKVQILADQIYSEVTQAEFDALEARVEESESAIDQQAKEINMKVSTTVYEEGLAQKANISDLADKVDRDEVTFTFAQMEEPTPQNVGDTWMQTDPRTWAKVKEFTWGQLKPDTWDAAVGYPMPKTYIWDGSKWLLMSDMRITQEIENYEKRLYTLETNFELTTEKIEATATKDYVDDQIDDVSSKVAQDAEKWIAEFNRVGLAGSQTGITKVDETGVEVMHSNIGGKTSMNADGFRLYDASGNVIGGLLNIDGESVSAVQRLANLLNTTFYLSVSPNIYGDGEHGVEFIIDGMNCGAITAQYLDGDVMGMHIRSEGGIAFSTPNETVSLGQIYANGVNVHYSNADPGGNDGDIWLCPVGD